MKTPKRYQDKPTPLMPEDNEPDWYVLNYWCQQAKRKNKLAQYKRTIARLTDEQTAVIRQFNALWLGDHLKAYSPEWEAFMILRKLKTPADDATLDEKLDHWLTLRKAAAKTLDAACFAAKAYGEAKERAACREQNAENAKQGKLIYIGAEQLTARKGKNNG